MNAAKNERSRAWCAACLCGILALLCLSAYAPAQQTHEFIYMARNSAHVNARGVAVGPDGKIFMANAAGGVKVYCCDGVALTCKGEGFDIGTPQNIAVRQDGTIFVACGGDGVRAFRCEDSTFCSTAQVRDGFWAEDVAVGPDGTVFVACGSDGLRAYEFTGDAFIPAGHVNEVPDHGRVYGIGVMQDGTIILATERDGLRAYTHTGDSFTLQASLPIVGDIRRLDINEEGTVYLAQGNSGLHAYQLENGAFLHLTSEYHNVFVSDVAVGPNGVIYASADDGLHAYTYSFQMLTLMATAAEETPAEGVCVYPDNTILLACGTHGLHRYALHGSEFICVSHVDDNVDYPGSALQVRTADDGTIFLADGEDGIHAYELAGGALQERAHMMDNGSVLSIGVGLDSSIWIGNDRNELSQYGYDGERLEFWGEFGHIGSDTNAYVTDFLFPDPGRVVVSTSAGELILIVSFGGMPWDVANVRPGSWISSLALGPNGEIFAAAGGAGIFAYRIVDNEFVQIASIYDGTTAGSIAVGPDGDIFALWDDGVLRAYELQGDSLHCTAVIEETANGYDIRKTDLAVGPDGTVFMSGTDGTFAYAYTGSAFIRTAELLRQSAGIAVGSDGTVFLPAGSEGMFAYRYAATQARVPRISVAPTAIDFGDVLVDQARPRSITIRNTGTAPLEFYVQKVVGANARDFRFSATLPDDLPMNAEIDLGISCYPLSGGEKSAIVQIGTNDPVAPLIEITLQANAVVDLGFDIIPPAAADAGPAQDVLPADAATLAPNYPNPFNPSTTIAFGIPRRGHVLVEVFDPVGRRIAVLVDDAVQAGVHRVQFDAADLPSGIYTSRLHWNGTVQMQRMMLVK